MSALSEKYGTSEETIKRMINDGVISCTWAKYEDVYSTYQTLSGTYKGESLVIEVSIRTNVPERTVYHILSRFK